MDNKNRTVPKNLYFAKNFRIECKSTAQNILYQEKGNTFLAKKVLNTSNSTPNTFQTFVKSLLLQA
jgi:hypothetical protein